MSVYIVVVFSFRLIFVCKNNDGQYNYNHFRCIILYS